MSPGAPVRRLLTATAAAGLIACAVTPLSNRIAVGEEAFVLGVGEGSDGTTDLYAAPAGSGAFVRLTYTRPEEKGPRLASSGTSVAFFRRARSPGASWSLVVLNLLTNAERESGLPAGAAAPERLGWTRDGAALVVRAGGLYRTPAPPEGLALAPVPADSFVAADSALKELLGEPPQGEVRPCIDRGVCIVAVTGERTPLGAGVTGAIRWGPDSVGYFVAGGFEVAPLGGGRSRRPLWSDAPSHLRDLTHHPGLRASGTPVPGISPGTPPSRP